MDFRILITLAGCSVLACASLYSALRERNALDDLSGTVYRPPGFEMPLTTAEPTFKKAKGKFNYKKDSFSESKQKGAVAGEAPTSYTSFDQFTSVDFNLKESEGQVDAGRTLSVNPDGIKGRNKDRYRQKYVVFLPAGASEGGNAGRSVHHKKKKVASVAAWLKGGMLKYVYTEKPYYEDMKVGADQFDNVKEMTSTGGVVRGNTSFDVTGRVGTEHYAANPSVEYKANKKIGKAKLSQ
jgi:hypothetical protein